MFVIFLIGHSDDNDRPRSVPFPEFDPLSVVCSTRYDSESSASWLSLLSCRRFRDDLRHVGMRRITSGKPPVGRNCMVQLQP